MSSISLLICVSRCRRPRSIGYAGDGDVDARSRLTRSSRRDQALPLLVDSRLQRRRGARSASYRSHGRERRGARAERALAAEVADVQLLEVVELDAAAASAASASLFLRVRVHRGETIRSFAGAPPAWSTGPGKPQWPGTGGRYALAPIPGSSRGRGNRNDERVNSCAEDSCRYRRIQA